MECIFFVYSHVASYISQLQVEGYLPNIAQSKFIVTDAILVNYKVESYFAKFMCPIDFACTRGGRIIRIIIIYI